MWRRVLLRNQWERPAVSLLREGRQKQVWETVLGSVPQTLAQASWETAEFYILCHWNLGDSWIRGRISESLISIIRNYLILLEMESTSDQKDSLGMWVHVWGYVSVCMCVHVYVSINVCDCRAGSGLGIGFENWILILLSFYSVTVPQCPLAVRWG